MLVNRFLFFLVGLIFGLGLAVSSMINPNKIQNFLDIFGNWDPSLIFVMLSATVVTFIGYRLVSKLPKPKLSAEFILPCTKSIDTKLITGAAIFGIGWGLSGFCPGPAITALGLGVMDPIYVVVGMVIGSACAHILARISSFWA